jgi:hypothetical protein
MTFRRYLFSVGCSTPREVMLFAEYWPMVLFERGWWFSATKQLGQTGKFRNLPRRMNGFR